MITDNIKLHKICNRLAISLSNSKFLVNNLQLYHFKNLRTLWKSTCLHPSLLLKDRSWSSILKIMMNSQESLTRLLPFSSISQLLTLNWVVLWVLPIKKQISSLITQAFLIACLTIPQLAIFHKTPIMQAVLQWHLVQLLKSKHIRLFSTNNKITTTCCLSVVNNPWKINQSKQSSWAIWAKNNYQRILKTLHQSLLKSWQVKLPRRTREPTVNLDLLCKSYKPSKIHLAYRLSILWWCFIKRQCHRCNWTTRQHLNLQGPFISNSRPCTLIFNSTVTLSIVWLWKVRELRLYQDWEHRGTNSIKAGIRLITCSRQWLWIILQH